MRPLVPQTAVFAAGGTRRSAVLAGLSTDGFDYVRFARNQMIDTFSLMFRYGVKHIFTAVSTHANFGEKGAYQSKLLKRVGDGVSEPRVLEQYQKLGWRVRLGGAESVPELQSAAERLIEATPTGDHTLWYTVAPSSEAPWEHLLATAQHTGATNRADLIRAVYGEDIPLANLYLGFGKPEVYADLVPPLLVGKMQCYFRQRLGYALSEEEWRHILYDFAYTRATWREDKTNREQKAIPFRDEWEKAPILGLGKRLGPFWFPTASNDLS
ncbi:MAG: hypothetical protein AAF614_21655 [Chloroflexota bacterium]